MQFNLLDPVFRLIQGNMYVAAALGAFTLSYLSYGLLGREYLGADDDYWPGIRHAILPRLHAVVSHVPGLYAYGQSHTEEYAGYVPLSKDEAEVRVESAGYLRNIAAGGKRNPRGWKSDGSWAKRLGGVRYAGDRLRETVDVPFIGGSFARFLQALGDITAVWQVHVTFYSEQRNGNSMMHAYVHFEYNSLNPLTALLHYRGVSMSDEKGVRYFVADCAEHMIPLNATPEQYVGSAHPEIPA